MKKKLRRIFCEHSWMVASSQEWLKIIECRKCFKNKLITERDGVIVK